MDGAVRGLRLRTGRARKRVAWWQPSLAVLYLWITSNEAIKTLIAPSLTQNYSVINALLENQDADTDDFFSIPVRIFLAIQSIGVPLDSFCMAVSTLLTVLFFRHRSNYRDFVIKFLLFVPAPLLYLGDPRKELFMLSFLYLTYLAIVKLKWLTAGGSLIIYAFLFRPYLLPVGALLAAPVRHKFFWFCLIACCALLMFEGQIFHVLKEIFYRRDVSYSMHQGEVRTAFANLNTNMGSWLDIAENYIYALLRLNFPMAFSFNYRDSFLQLYVFLFFGVVFLSVKNRHLRDCILLNSAIYPLFEPDLGSYLRHLSSVFPLVFAGLALASDHAARSIEKGRKNQLDNHVDPSIRLLRYLRAIY